MTVCVCACRIMYSTPTVVETPATASASAASASAESASVESARAASYSIETIFKKAKNHDVVIRPKGKVYGIFIPASLTAKRKRLSVVFSTLAPEGLHPRFGDFLNHRMHQVVMQWKTPKQAHTWTQHALKSWKQQVSQEVEDQGTTQKTNSQLQRGGQPCCQHGAQ